MTPAKRHYRKGRLKVFAPDKLKKARVNRGLSLAGLGDRVGIAKQSIDQYEKGSNLPTLENFLKLSAELGVEPGDLLKYDQGRKPAGATAST